MTAISPPPGHVFAAAWTYAYLRERGAAVTEVLANGVVIAEPEKAAHDLRSRYASEPRTKLFTRVLKLRKWAATHIFKPRSKETLRLPAPKTRWQFENVRGRVTIQARLADGRSASFSVPFVRRDESMQLLTLSSAAMTGACLLVLPGLGNLALVPGAVIALATAGHRYITGDIRSGNAAVLTACKLVGFGIMDCVAWGVTNLALGAAVLGAQTAVERYRRGEGLIDTSEGEPILRRLAGVEALPPPAPHVPLGLGVDKQLLARDLSPHLISAPAG